MSIMDSTRNCDVRIRDESLLAISLSLLIGLSAVASSTSQVKAEAMNFLFDKSLSRLHFFLEFSFPGSRFPGARDSRPFSFPDSREIKCRHSRRKAGMGHRQLFIK